MVLLVVDTQDMIMTEELYEFNIFVKNVETLISTARQKIQKLFTYVMMMELN